MKTLVIIKPDWTENIEFLHEFMDLVKKNGLHIVSIKKLFLGESFWKDFYIKYAGYHFFEILIEYMSSRPSIFIIIEGKDSVDLVRWKIVGRMNSGLRSKYKIDELRNVAHASDSLEAASTEINLFLRSNLY